ncbi:Glucan endo-1,3-beta-glucosidase 9 [Ananas comosus]|uniref:glucan endo-1,3-beta-D-glucosidase n=1 Tax=Ananas comosus TaxID=4615 RepID=A0A199W8D5_ANACO|nr:Glucan endo-1,3-beta-glucosidase 9 [Ananas comosus]
MAMRCGHRPVILLLVVFVVVVSSPFSTALGVNWGGASSQPLPAPKVVTGLLRPNGVARVKLADADPAALASLVGSGIGVAVGIPNEMLRDLGASKKAAASWVHDNVTRYLSDRGPGARLGIEYVAVGDEPFLLSYGKEFEPYVVGAATNIRLALTAAKADRIKVIVPCSFDVIQTESNLPSKSHFRPDLNKTMTDLLSFLANYSSPFVIDVNPFSALQQNKNLSLDYLLFQKKSRPITDGNSSYNNFFDLSIDSLISSLSKVGFGEMEVVVGRIGWPTDGAVNATPSVAQTFNKALIDHLKTKSGTPLRPKRFPTETYLFSLLDEDRRSITAGNYERHWGIFTFDGQAKYNVDLGQGSKSLESAHNVEYLYPRWCVVNNNNDKDLSNVTAGASEACSNADCTALSPGSSCFGIGWPANVSYAFNSYYQQRDQSQESCDFGGLGLITTVDPSLGDCRFAIALRTSFSTSIHETLIATRMMILSAFVWLYLLSFS